MMLVEREDNELPLTMQAELLSISRSSLYYQPRVPLLQEEVASGEAKKATSYLKEADLKKRLSVPLLCRTFQIQSAGGCTQASGES